MYGRGAQVRFGPPQTPDVIKILMIANVGVYLLQLLAPGLTGLLAVTPALVWQGGFIWQPATYMWLHSPHQVTHLLFNMFALWMFGSPVASYWGARKFLRFYLVCGIGAGLLIAAWPGIPVLLGLGVPAQYTLPTLGASGAIFGVLLAYSMLWPDRTIMLLFPPIPLKAIYFVPFIFLLELAGPSNISHIGHIGGLIVGWLALRRMGVVQGFGLRRLRWRWRRYRMRRKLRAVHDEERRRHDDHRTYH